MLGDWRHVDDWATATETTGRREVAGVAVDSGDRVYVLTRFPARVLVYSSEGQFLHEWGRDMMSERAHSITIAPDQTVYFVDDALHCVRQFTSDGVLLRTIGVPGIPAVTGYCLEVGIDSIKGGGPFNRPTDVVVAPNGDLFVSDGYGNCRVHRFASDGSLIGSWGRPGSGDGAFHLPHGVALDARGQVLVADRENDRIQVFDQDGRFIEDWKDVQRPTSIHVAPDGLVYVAELMWAPGQRSYRDGTIEEARPASVTILDPRGRVRERIRGVFTTHEGSTRRMCAPHSICVDSTGALYVGEVIHSFAGRDAVPEEERHDLYKLVRETGP